MKLPILQGIIKRRLLVNFRADAETIKAILPDQFRPKLQNGKAIAGICLIRLEHIRPKHVPEFVGISSENAAHRIAVEWDADGETQEGVFIPRRDTDSKLNSMAGGTLFPGEQNRADFTIVESDAGIEYSMRSRDAEVSLDLKGTFSDEFPGDSIFASLDETSNFFEKGSLGYSATRENKHLDGIRLETKEWLVKPFDLSTVNSSFYDNKNIFPDGTIEFDHALVMQNIAHEWHSAPDYELPR